MTYKALKSFSGVVSMRVGEKREIEDEAVAADLLKAGYIKEEAPKMTGRKPTAKN